MSSIKTVISIDENAKAWLESLGVEVPLDYSRNPTGYEIKDALNKIKGYETDISDNGIGKFWQAHIVSESNSGKSEWATLNIIEYAGDNHEQSIYFSGGTMNAMVEFVQFISKEAGPQILYDAADGEPIVITHNKSSHSPH